MRSVRALDRGVERGRGGDKEGGGVGVEDEEGREANA